jgi:hypothetical protein
MLPGNDCPHVPLLLDELSLRLKATSRYPILAVEFADASGVWLHQKQAGGGRPVVAD